MTGTHYDLESHDISGLRFGKTDAVRLSELDNVSTYTPSGFPAALTTFGGLGTPSGDQLGHGSEQHAKCPPRSLIAVLVPLSRKQFIDIEGYGLLDQTFVSIRLSRELAQRTPGRR